MIKDPRARIQEVVGLRLRAQSVVHAKDAKKEEPRYKSQDTRAKIQVVCPHSREINWRQEPSLHFSRQYPGSC